MAAAFFQITDASNIASDNVAIGMTGINGIEFSKKKYLECLFYDLSIESKSPCSYFTIGKVKKNINLLELINHPNCLTNEDAYDYKLNVEKWANNYTSPKSRKIFDCHFIKYTETCDGIDFNIKILFFSLKKAELLIPNVIMSDVQIISIISRHIMIYNNLTNSIYHNYSIECLSKEISKDVILDLRYQNNSLCKTQLYNYQRSSIQWMLDIEANLPIIEFTEDKILDLGPEMHLYFNYSQYGKPDSFIPYGKLPKVQLKGAIICDEVGLGKTIQTLSLVLSKPDIKTLIIVPNHIKDHWQAEMKKHFIVSPFDNLVLLVSYSEFSMVSNDVVQQYQRILVDELAEMYDIKKPENNKLFERILGFGHFKYVWGITATPFIDDSSMYNIIKFLMATKKIYNSAVGNFMFIQEQFKPYFRKNIKANVQAEVNLPDVNIINIGLNFSYYERQILDAMELDTTYSINERLRIISNAMLELSNSEKNVITIEELKKLTVKRFLEKVDEAKEIIVNFNDKLENVRNELIEEITIHNLNDDSLLVQDYNRRIQEIEHNILVNTRILERREVVYNGYLEITKNIEDIISKIDSEEDQNNGQDGAQCDAQCDDMEIDHEKMCSICYSGFSKTIVLFVRCRHFTCDICFERSHKKRPNVCLICRSVAEVGEINYIGCENTCITSTKNTEILRLLNTVQDKFIIFSRFDKFIKPLVNFLNINNFNSISNSKTYGINNECI